MPCLLLCVYRSVSRMKFLPAFKLSKIKIDQHFSYTRNNVLLHTEQDCASIYKTSRRTPCRETVVGYCMTLMENINT
jgi:hypothetical protein